MILRKSFYIRWSAGRSPRVHEVNPGRDPSVEAVESFFNSGCMLREINCTIIALVPKVPNPESMHDYRPISCCNTIYKCISKIIATRIKHCLPELINTVCFCSWSDY